MAVLRVTTAERRERGEAQRVTRNAQRATFLGVLVLLSVLSIGRLLISAFSYGIPAWFDEELNPLIDLIARGQPIAQVDPRQYGVVVFLVFDVPVRIVGPNMAALATYAAWVALPCAVAAFVLMARRYAADDTAQ